MRPGRQRSTNSGHLVPNTSFAPALTPHVCLSVMTLWRHLSSKRNKFCGDLRHPNLTDRQVRVGQAVFSAPEDHRRARRAEGPDCNRASRNPSETGVIPSQGRRSTRRRAHRRGGVAARRRGRDRGGHRSGRLGIRSIASRRHSRNRIDKSIEGPRRRSERRGRRGEAHVATLGAPRRAVTPIKPRAGGSPTRRTPPIAGRGSHMTVTSGEGGIRTHGPLAQSPP